MIKLQWVGETIFSRFIVDMYFKIEWSIKYSVSSMFYEALQLAAELKIP